MRYILAALLSLSLATPALAAFEGPGVAPAVTKAAQVQSAQDDAPVMLMGNIVEKVPGKKNKYVFQDDSGKVIVEIGHKEFAGQKITPTDKVRLTGNVDYSRKKDSKVDVDLLEVIK